MHSDIFGKMSQKNSISTSGKSSSVNNLCLLCATVLVLFLVLTNPLGTNARSTLPNLEKPEVDYYEPVFYDPSHLISQHKRAKREIGFRPASDHSNNFYKDDSLSFSLQSKSNNFKLKLDVDNSVFHPDVVIENSDGLIKYDTSRVLTGYLDDEPDSVAHGVLTPEGYFDGYISTPEDEFYIEPSHRYSSLANQSQGVLYRTKDVQWPKDPPACASHELHLKRKEDVLLFHNESTESPNWGSESEQRPLQSVPSAKHSRRKRYAVDPKKKTCMLFLQADHLFYQHFGSEEACIDVMTRHIQRVNEIYRTTDFDMDDKPDGISFMIKRVKVHTSNQSLSPAYRYHGEFQVIKFLELFSEGDFDSFCLAYMFTFRDFEGGTLGLAWTGDLKNAGGVCERKGHFRGGLKSLNTGIITLLNYGKVVLPPVSHVTLSHEIGHNFGSPHDPEGDKQCTPGGKEGNYIMYARATAGDQKNNNKFSPCSLKSILPVLNFKARDMHGCFVEPQGAICGNREVEDGEECDCGWEEDCTEPCCFPMKIRPGKHEPPCRLRPRKDCSPSQGPCCTGNCTLKFGEKCRDDNGCRDRAYCDGTAAHCPQSRHKPNKTVCNEESVCFMGECTGSICLAYGLEVCQCNAESWESATKSCELCCKLPGEGNPCLSSFQWNHAPLDVPDLYSKPGSPCKNYTGYCDPYHSCREVDPSGPLSTLRNLLLADEGLAAIASWIDHHWYAVLTFVVLLLVIMILTAKLCGKNAKARLRKITVLHSNVEAIQIHRSYLDEQGEHVIHPMAIRKKIPFKKKVRERRSKSRAKRKERKNKPGGNNSSSPSKSTGSGDNQHSHSQNSIWKRRQRSERSKGKKTEAVSAALEAAGVSGASSSNDVVVLAGSSSTSNNHHNSHSHSNGIPHLSPSTDHPLNGLIGAVPHVGGHNIISHEAHGNGGGSSNAARSAPGVVMHEPKTAIVPNVHGKRLKRKERKPSSRKVSSSATKDATAHKKSKRSSSKVQDESSSSKHKRSSSSSPTKKSSSPETGDSAKNSSRRNIQVLYKPPFSVKVQIGPQEKSKDIKNKEVVPKSSQQHRSVAQHHVSGATNNILAPVPPPLPKNNSTSSSSSSNNASPRKKSSTSTSSSFLQRRKGNLKHRSSKNNSELKVLIPKNRDEEDLSSPVTPMS